MYPTYLNKIYTTEILKAQKLFNIEFFFEGIGPPHVLYKPPKNYMTLGIAGSE